MVRGISATLALIFVLVGSSLTVVAQDSATPAAFDPSPDIMNVDGSVLGTMQIVSVEDGYAQFDPATPPGYGMRFVAVTLDIRNSGERPWSFNPAHLLLVDQLGFVISGTSLRFIEESRIALLTGQDIAPGATLTGSLVYQVALGVSPARLVYSPTNDRMVTIADLIGTEQVLDAPVVIYASDTSPMAEISVTMVEFPFTDYDPNAPPERGSTYLLLSVSVTNPGPRPLRVDPQAFLVVDSDGFVERPVTIRRGEGSPADLVNLDPLPPGSTVEGAIGYLVLGGVGLDRLTYAPSRDRMVDVAILTIAGEDEGD